MTQATRIPIYPRRQCEGTLTEQISQQRQAYADHRGKVDLLRCTFPARVIIDGKCYCARHGGDIALKRLLGETE